MTLGSLFGGASQPTALLAIALACASAACDRQTTPGAALAPAPVPTGLVFLTTGATGLNPAVHCASAGSLTTDLNVVVSSTRGLLVEQVTLHLIDGSNIGGPGVTFPQSMLNVQFVNTTVVAGSSRSFGLRPTFKCGGSAPRSIHGEVAIVDARGLRSTMSASMTLP